MCLNVLFISFYGVCAILGDGNLESHMYTKTIVFFLIPLHPEEMKHVSKRTVCIFLWSMCHLRGWQFGKPYVNQNQSFFLIALHPEEMKHVSKRTVYIFLWSMCHLRGGTFLQSHM